MSSLIAPSSLNAPYPGATPLGVERLQVAMAHLISIKQQLEADLEGSTPWRRTSTSDQIQDLGGDQTSDTESIFDDTASLSSQSTHITTSSNNSASTADEQDHTEYRYRDLDEILV